MKYALIITPKNVNSRIVVGALLVFAGILVVAVSHGGRPAILGLIMIPLGCIIYLFGLFWFFRMYIAAWFR